MTATGTRTEKWPHVTRHDPCPICQKPDWCTVSPDGAVACCMRVTDNAFKIGRLKSGEPYGLHRLRDDRPRDDAAPRPRPQPTPPDDDGFDVPTARAVYAVVAEACAAGLPDHAVAELRRRFGPVYGPLAAREFGIGYCDSPALAKALGSVGRRSDAVAAGVLRPATGQAVRSMGGRLVIPYRRGGGTWDLRGSGIKGRDETKEMSLPGSYASREVDGLFFNHDALDALPPGGTIHLAGGAWKTIALHLAGLPAIGTRGEGELGDAQIAALVAADVAEVILHIDAEDPRDGEDLSPGRRLALPKADRLEAAGLRVLVAEPPREPGTGKADPDALLREFGPRLVRAYALSALPLAAWRVAIGVASAGVPPEVAQEIEEQRRKAARAQQTLTSFIRIRSNNHIKSERDTIAAVALDLMAASANGQADPEGWVRQTASTIAATVGKGEKRVQVHRQRAADWGLIELKQVEEFDPQTRQRRTPYYVRAKESPEKILDVLVTLNPTRIDRKTGEEKAEWGGERHPCASCGSTNTRRAVVIVCGDCGHVSKPLSDRNGAASAVPSAQAFDPATEHGPDEPDADAPSIPPMLVEVPSPPASYPPGELAFAEEDEEDDDPDVFDPHTCNYPGCAAPLKVGQRLCDFHLERPFARKPTGLPLIAGVPVAGAAPATLPVAPAVAGPAPPDRPSWCLNYRGQGKGCQHRVERRGEAYCPSCIAEGYVNGPGGAGEGA